VSALAVYLEEQGIATTVIGLIRLHLEKIRPPRALWVPFELGRPMGPPNYPEFQTQVLLTALQLLEAPASSGPVILSDFADDEPGQEADPHWREPVLKAHSLADEVTQLQPLYRAAQEKFGRTTVGISGIPVEQAAHYLLRFDGDDPLPSPHADMSELALLRFACDDIKAFYLEAASAAGDRPNSRQLEDWFWKRSVAAQTIRALREFCLASADDKRKLVGNSLVPRRWL
jgi:hypothetical protein